MKPLSLLLLPIALAFGSPVVASAQTLTGSLSGTIPSTVNLTTQGTKDWLKFDYTTAPVITQMSGGSSLSFANGSGVGGEAQITPDGNPTAFSWSNGTSPLIGSSVTTGLQLQSSYGNTNNGFTITTPSEIGNDQTLTLYFGGNDADNYQVSAYLSDPGSTPYLATFTGGYPYTPKVLVLDFNSATSGQILTLNVKPLDNSYYAYNNVDIFAATLSESSAAPEPSTYALMVAGFASLMILRRYRRSAIVSSGPHIMPS